MLQSRNIIACRNSIRNSLTMLLFLILLLSFESAAQSWRIDSLQQALVREKASDGKLQLLLSLAEETAYMSPRRSLAAARAAEALALTLRNKSAQCTALVLMTHALRRLGESAEAKTCLDRSSAVVPVTDPVARAMVADARSSFLDLEGFPVRALKLTRLADSLLQRVTPRPLHVQVKTDLIVQLVYRGETEEAQRRLDAAFTLARQLGDPTALALCNFAWSHLAYQQEDNRNYRGALEAALELFASQGDSLGMCGALMNLGGLFLEKGDMRGSEEYLLRCRSIASRIGYRRMLAGTSTNVGIMYYQQGKLDSAMVLLTEARSVYEALGEPLGVTFNTLHIAAILDLQRQYGKALELSLNVKQYLETRQVSLAKNITKLLKL